MNTEYVLTKNEDYMVWASVATPIIPAFKR